MGALVELPRIRNLSAWQGETKEILNFALGTWVVESAQLAARKVGDEEPTVALSSLGASPAITIVDVDDAGSEVSVILAGSVSTETPAGDYEYEIKIWMDAKPVSIYAGVFTLHRGVVTDE